MIGDKFRQSLPVHMNCGQADQMSRSDLETEHVMCWLKDNLGGRVGEEIASNELLNRNECKELGLCICMA